MKSSRWKIYGPPSSSARCVKTGGQWCTGRRHLPLAAIHGVQLAPGRVLADAPIADRNRGGAHDSADHLGLLSVSLALVPAPARAESLLEGIVRVLVDGGNSYAWEKVEIPGSVCGNGSQYKFFVRRTSSPNLLFFFEGGGACWDYELQRPGGHPRRGESERHPDDYISSSRPSTSRRSSTAPTRACPSAPEQHRHQRLGHGLHAVLHRRRARRQPPRDLHRSDRRRAADHVAPQRLQQHGRRARTSRTQAFPSINKLLVTGFSAGGTGTSAGYWLVRTRSSPSRATC